MVRRTSATAPGFVTTITPSGGAGTGLFVTLFKVDQDNSQRVYYANDNALYRTTSGSTVTTVTWTKYDRSGYSGWRNNDNQSLLLQRVHIVRQHPVCFWYFKRSCIPARWPDRGGCNNSSCKYQWRRVSCRSICSSIAGNPREWWHSIGYILELWSYQRFSGLVMPMQLLPHGRRLEGSAYTPFLQKCNDSYSSKFKPGILLCWYFSWALAAIGLPGTVSWTWEGASSIWKCSSAKHGVTTVWQEPAYRNSWFGMWKTGTCPACRTACWTD